MYGDLVLKNGDNHRFAGFAKIYFGKIGYWLSILMTVVEMFFVLAIYLILSQSFFNIIWPQMPSVFGVLIFWWLGSLVIFSGTKRLVIAEFLALAGTILLILFMGYWGFGDFFNKNFSLISSNYLLWLLPFGPILFALNGRQAVSAIIHYFDKLGKKRILAKKAIIWGTIVPAIVYVIFIIGVLGASSYVSEDSISGFVGSGLPSFFLCALGFLGIMALISSYLVIGLDVKMSLLLDIKFSKFISSFLVIILPLVIYFSNLGTFLSLIGVAGGLFIGLEGIMILWMWKKSQKQKSLEGNFIKKISPVFWWLMILVFAASIGYILIS